ncbi:AraC family ligand binding domain-containing protein [Pseudonocardia sp. HH130629-09]|uniref:AraC family ligand binding domain-containing protein n=1 Tax=Pseudonocardia sp. HH130629-09 TaxID=1641402 RepID=UPI000B05B506|nr:AraC family ligand binding domain-containing protein [Pseudonocardia sp. HH130629-09]
MSGTVLATARTRFDDGFSFDLHTHDFHLLSWSVSATVTHHTSERDWLVPPTHALWMPAGVPHAIEVVRGGLGYGVILTGTTPWTEPTGVLVTPLVRELIVHLGTPGTAARDRAEQLLVTLLEPVPSTTFTLPVPTTHGCGPSPTPWSPTPRTTATWPPGPTTSPPASAR